MHTHQYPCICDSEIGSGFSKIWNIQMENSCLYAVCGCACQIKPFQGIKYTFMIKMKNALHWNLNHGLNFNWFPEMAEHVCVFKSLFSNTSLMDEFLLLLLRSLCIIPGSLTLKQSWRKEAKGGVISGSADTEKTRKKVQLLFNIWTFVFMIVKLVSMDKQLLVCSSCGDRGRWRRTSEFRGRENWRTRCVHGTRLFYQFI